MGWAGYFWTFFFFWSCLNCCIISVKDRIGEGKLMLRTSSRRLIESRFAIWFIFRRSKLQIVNPDKFQYILLMNDEDSSSFQDTETEALRLSSNREASGTLNQFSTIRLPTANDSASKKTPYSCNPKSKSTQLQNTLRKPIKIKLFQKDTEKSKVLCFEFPLDGVPNILPLTEEQEEMSPSTTQPLVTRGLALSKFKMLRNFFTNYQEEKKRTTAQEMNMLGLRIKRIDCGARKGKDDTRKTVNRPRGSSSNYPNKEGEFGISGIIGENIKFRSSIAIEVEPCSSEMTTLYPHNKSEISCSRLKVNRRDSVTSNRLSPQKNQKKNSPKKNFKFYSAQPNKIYDGRIESVQQFIFLIRFAHNVYSQQFDIDNPDTIFSNRNEAKNKIWIGFGNNCLLIKSLFKRRWWWQVVDEKNLNQVNFMWTQLKQNGLFAKQKPSQTQRSYKQILQEKEEQQIDGYGRTAKTIVKQRTTKCTPPQDYLKKVLNSNDIPVYRKALPKRLTKMNKKLPLSNFKQLVQKPLLTIQPAQKVLMHNHLENNFFLGNKKAMFHNLKQYYELRQDNVFNYLPLTFHIKDGIKDAQYKRFIHYYKRRANYIKKQQMLLENCESDSENHPQRKLMRNIWIIKPGQLSNRGNGITVVDELYEVNNILTKKDAHSNGTAKTYILQLYIDRPMLYNRRKFDIRHYMMISNMYGIMRGYWYSEGYIRTAGYEFDIYNFERQIHLTNDAVQKHCQTYGKYEAGNKLSYQEFQRYLDGTYPKKKYNFGKQIIPAMKQLATDAVKSVYLKLSPDNLQHNFQIFGLDFMIDENFKVWLIEINTNPCLQLSCPLLSRLIPVMVEQTLRLTVDVMFPPPGHYTNSTKHLVPDLSLAGVKYQMIFDSTVNGQEVKNLYKNVKVSRLMDQIGEISEDQEYADNGVEIKFEDL